MGVIMRGSSWEVIMRGSSWGGHRGRSLSHKFIEFNRPCAICYIQHVHTHIFKVNIGRLFDIILTIFYNCYRDLI